MNAPKTKRLPTVNRLENERLEGALDEPWAGAIPTHGIHASIATCIEHIPM